MRKKKFLKKISLIVAVMMCLSLTACANNNTGGTSSTGDEGTSSTDTSAEATTDAGEETSEASESTATGEMTEVGTPRAQTLIVECQSPTDTPGQFNTYMHGTAAGFGIHQLMSAMMWEMDTVSGNQFGEVADGMPESNEDFTEHIVKIREGIKWSDGVDLTAKDVAFTFNMIKDNSEIGQSDYYNTVFDSITAEDDYTVKIITKEAFPRLALRMGVTIWGNDLRIVPEHIYSQVDDVTTFVDNEPVVAGPYTVSAYDELGKWILYERREDWENSTVGVVTGKMPQAEYIWFRNLGDDTTRQMSLINNDVDILTEVTPEMLEFMMDQNDNIAAWYDDFPYALSDDPGAKGMAFQMGKAPYDNADFRWAITLAINFDEVSDFIFDGIGRSSMFPTVAATAAMQEFYYLPLLPWVEEFELDLGDGTTLKPFDGDYATRMADSVRAKGYDVPSDRDELISMFGIGTWKYDPEAAEKLLIKAGLEKNGDVWYFEGEPFTINLTYLADTEAQAGRGVQATYDQLIKFGLDCNISSESTATWDTNGATGDFDIAGYWPSGGITKDLYAQINGWDADLIVPIGERGSGQGSRWNNAEATRILHEMAKLSPEDERSYELALEFTKNAITEMPVIGYHSGTKFVPTNKTIWTNYPSAENPYNGPWWWWSCFKYLTTEITPAG